jgi:hypothetical protein
MRVLVLGCQLISFADTTVQSNPISDPKTNNASFFCVI